jgi:hypothetical protein
MVWGIGIGAYLMVIGGAILIVGAMMQFISKDTGRLPTPAPMPPQPAQYQPPQDWQRRQP